MLHLANANHPPAPVRPEEPVQRQSDLEYLDQLCRQYEHVIAPTRQKLITALRIPLSPAILVVIGVVILKCMKIIPETAAYLALAGDLTYVALKIRSIFEKAAEAKAAGANVIDYMRPVIERQGEAGILRVRAILQNYSPELSEAAQDLI